VQITKQAGYKMWTCPNQLFAEMKMHAQNF
jgi:hypothetical protein